jgi:hypothetical protein
LGYRAPPRRVKKTGSSGTSPKTVDIIQLIDHIPTAFPPEPEEFSAVEALLREPWDPTDHIENLFQTVKEGTETLLLMKYVTTKTDCEKLFIKYAFMQQYAIVDNLKKIPSNGKHWLIKIRKQANSDEPSSARVTIFTIHHKMH